MQSEWITSWNRVIDFANGAPMDNFELALSNDINGQVTSLLFNDTYAFAYAMSPNILPLFTWTHLAVVVDNIYFTIYTDGLQVSQTTQNPNFIMRNLIRHLNYIGKSNWWWDGNAKCKYRNLRIYNRALSSTEITNDMNN